MEFKKRNPKIFVISGKANSGKDTTAEIIDNQIMLKGLKVVNLQISSYIKMYASKISGWDGSEETKPRTLLQELGTDVIRNKLNKAEMFIDRQIDDIEIYSYFYDAIIVPDIRLPREIDSIKEKFDNVVTIKVERINFETNLSGKEQKHSTETAMDSYEDFDYEITNDTLEKLKEDVYKIYQEETKWKS